MIYFRPINRELPSTKFQPENNIFFHDFFLSFLLQCFLNNDILFLFHFFICPSNLCLFFITPFKMFYFCLSVCFGSPSCFFVFLVYLFFCLLSRNVRLFLSRKEKCFRSSLDSSIECKQAAKLRKNKTLKLLFNRKVLLRKLLEAF
jgi:hypothetical protein